MLSPTVRRRIHRILLLLALPPLAALLFLAAALLLTVLPVNRDFRIPDSGIDVYVEASAVHTDLLLPAADAGWDWRKTLNFNDFAGADSSFEYVAFGWGDREFYLNTPTWEDLSMCRTLRALFWPTVTIMHVRLLRKSPPAGKLIRRTRLTPAQYRQLCDYIDRSFRHQTDGHYRLIHGYSYGIRDRFYEGNGTYQLFFNCNNWTNAALKTAGVKTARWAPFPQSVLYHLD